MNGRDQDDMNPLARKALERLLKSAGKHEAGVASRRPALTSSALASFHGLRNLNEKEDFEAVMSYAQSEEAITVQRPRHDRQGLIERIELADVGKLAQLLGDVPHAVTAQGRCRRGRLPYRGLSEPLRIRGRPCSAALEDASSGCAGSLTP